MQLCTPSAVAMAVSNPMMPCITRRKMSFFDSFMMMSFFYVIISFFAGYCPVIP